MYYVYVGRVAGEVVYIGKGKQTRYLHLNSGISSCYQANKCHFTGGLVDVDIIYRTESEEDALELESYLIFEAQPAWNIVGTDSIAVRPNRRGKSYKKDNAKSQYYGVKASKGQGKPWRSWVKIGRDSKHIASHNTELEAALARDAYILEHGLSAILNFPVDTCEEVV